MLLCPTCDEPFTPQFARRCNGCGHEFPDGFDDYQAEQELRLGFFWWLLVRKLIGFEETQAERVGEGLNPRILFCLGGIILVTAAVVIYLWRLF